MVLYSPSPFVWGEELQQDRVDVSTAVSGPHSQEWVGLALGRAGGEAQKSQLESWAWHTHLGSGHSLYAEMGPE